MRGVKRTTNIAADDNVRRQREGLGLQASPQPYVVSGPSSGRGGYSEEKIAGAAFISPTIEYRSVRVGQILPIK